MLAAQIGEIALERLDVHTLRIIAHHLLEVQRPALADTDDLVDSTPDGCGLFKCKSTGEARALDREREQRS